MKIFSFVIYFLLAFSFFACSSKQNNITSDNSEKVSSIKEATQTPTSLTEKDIKRRDEIQKQMIKGENLHDGAIDLQYIGDINSVPALLVVLKKNPPNSNGTMVCTTAHAILALRKITNTNAGSKFEDWDNWWAKYQEQNNLYVFKNSKSIRKHIKRNKGSRAL